MSNSGFRFTFILSIVFINWLKPSNAKNSACKGTIKDFATTKAITVSRLNDGGQSINIYEDGELQERNILDILHPGFTGIDLADYSTAQQIRENEEIQDEINNVLGLYLLL